MRRSSARFTGWTAVASHILACDDEAGNSPPATAVSVPSLAGISKISRRAPRLLARARLFLLKSLCAALVAMAPLDLSAQVREGWPQANGWTNDCDFCLASQGVSPLEVGASGFRVDLRYLRLGTIYLNGAKADNSERELETHLTQQYSLIFALSSRFTISGIVPLAQRHSERINEDGSMVTGDQFGLGDVALLLRYKPLVDHAVDATTILSFAAGVKLPSGRTDGKDSEGNLLDAHIQLGTGSTDFIAGVSGFIAWERLALIINALGAVTSEGANGHRFGNNLNYDLTARYRLYPADYDETMVFATLGINGEWRGREIQDGNPVDNSGGNVTYLAPGLQLYMSPSVSFDAIFQYALIHGLHGEQLGEDYRIMGGLQVLLW